MSDLKSELIAFMEATGHLGYALCRVDGEVGFEEATAFSMQLHDLWDGLKQDYLRAAEDQFKVATKEKITSKTAFQQALEGFKEHKDYVTKYQDQLMDLLTGLAAADKDFSADEKEFIVQFDAIVQDLIG
mgnify:CR=1 FL=1